MSVEINGTTRECTECVKVLKAGNLCGQCAVPIALGSSDEVVSETDGWVCEECHNVIPDSNEGFTAQGICFCCEACRFMWCNGL